MIKKWIIAGCMMLFAFSSLQAQKYAYVDSEFILEQIPDYNDAQKKLDNIAEQWQNEITKRFDAVDQMYKAYQAEQVLLTDEMRQKKEEEIIAEEKKIKDFQKSKFGYEGELFKKRQELIKPIQDQVYDGISKLAETKGYDLIFDKSAGTALLYASPKLDKSAEVLKIMGY